MADGVDSAKGEPYGLDPQDEKPAGGKPAEAPAPRPEVASPPRPELAAPDQESSLPDPSAIRALDVCPNCGTPLGPVDTVVCMRCGFDLKTLKVIKTKTVAEAQPAPAEEVEQELLSEPGAGGMWLPSVLGAMSLAILLIGCLAGARGLVHVGEETASFLARLEALLRVVLRTAILAVSGLGGLYVLAHILRTRMGDLKLAAVRMAGIMASVGLIAFFSLPKSPPLERLIESIAQGLVYVGLAMFFFSLSLRDAVTLLGVTVFAVGGLLLVSGLLQWATPPV